MATNPPKTLAVDQTDQRISEVIVLSELVMVFIVGSLGNALVLYVFAFKKKHTRTRFETLLVPLAITDLIASVSIPSLFFYGTFTQFKRWDFGTTGCKLISTLFPISITISQSILVLISYERYKSVTSPFGENLSKRFLFLWVAFTAVLTGLLVWPYTDALEIISDKKYGIETCMPVKEKHLQLYVYSLGNMSRDILATTAMVILGCMTSKSIHVSGAQIMDETSASRRLKTTRKARKMLIAVVVAFSCCVIPLDIFQVVVYTSFITNSAMGRRSYEMILQANTHLTVLQVANSATNVIIYSKMHQDFMRNVCACAKYGKGILRTSLTRFTSLKDQSANKTPVVLFSGEFNWITDSPRATFEV